MPAHSSHAFLDPVGTGTVPVPATRRPAAAGRAGAIVALAPVLAMLAALALVALTGLSRRSALPEAVEPWLYGFFLDRYPLFAFALIYAANHLVAVAAGPGPASTLRRVVFCLAGIAVLGAAGLYPTAGGVILRGGFAVGSQMFLTQQPLWLAYGIGAGVCAALVAVILEAFAFAANRALRPSVRRLGSAALAFLALWAGAALLGLAHDLGFGPWPRRAMHPGEAALAAIMLAVASLPHAALTALRAHRRRV